MTKEKVDFCNGPIQRQNSQHNLAFSGTQTLELRLNTELRKAARLISWAAHDKIPQNHTFLIKSVMPSFGEVGSYLGVVCQLSWTVQNVTQTAEIDFVRGTKFQLVADSFDLSTYLDRPTVSALNGDVVVSALWTQNGLANVNGIGPQRSYTFQESPVPAQRIAIPPFARYVSVLKSPYNVDFALHQVLDDGLTAVASMQVGAGGDVIKWPIANSAVSIRWVPNGAVGAEALVVVFDIDL